MKWYRLAAEQGDVDAQRQVLILEPKIAEQKPSPKVSGDYQKGFDAYVGGDYATALRGWKPLAEQGDTTAQISLGVMYKTGRGVPDAGQRRRPSQKTALQKQ